MSGAAVIGWALRTPLGTTVDDVVRRLLAGERTDGALAAAPLDGSRHARFLGPLGLLALETAHEAVATAGITGSERVGVFAAVGGLRVEWSELVPVLAAQRDDGTGAWAAGLDRIHPFWMLRHLSNNAHALLSADLGARGEGATFGGATAGAQAIASAIRALDAETIDAAVVLAYDTLRGPESLTDLDARGMLAIGPRAAPYDEASAGYVAGEATAAVVLVRDGSNVLARVTAASGADGSPGEPNPATIARVASRVVQRQDRLVVDGAARTARAADHAERAALAPLVGDNAPLTAITAAMGALGAATSLVQLIAIGELLRRDRLPPIAGLARPSPGALRPIAVPEAADRRAALCISTGAPGLAAALRVEVSS